MVKAEVLIFFPRSNFGLLALFVLSCTTICTWTALSWIFKLFQVSFFPCDLGRVFIAAVEKHTSSAMCEFFIFHGIYGFIVILSDWKHRSLKHIRIYNCKTYGFYPGQMQIKKWSYLRDFTLLINIIMDKFNSFFFNSFFMIGMKGLFIVTPSSVFVF